MKTRQEMIYDFMLAVCANVDTYTLLPSTAPVEELEAHEGVYMIAAAMADEYLKKATYS
jgi:hypothetical protein